MSIDSITPAVSYQQSAFSGDPPRAGGLPQGAFGDSFSFHGEFSFRETNPVSQARVRHGVVFFVRVRKGFFERLTTAYDAFRFVSVWGYLVVKGLQQKDVSTGGEEKICGFVMFLSTRLQMLQPPIVASSMTS